MAGWWLTAECCVAAVLMAECKSTQGHDGVVDGVMRVIEAGLRPVSDTAG